MLKRIFLAVVMLAVPAAAFAQGTIEGRVIDAQTGGGLSNARVAIAALNVSVGSGAAGAYSIPDVPAGDHVVEVRLIGYAVMTRTVTVTSGQTLNVDFGLGLAAINLGELVVVGSRAQPRTVTESMVPVDVIPVSEISRQAETNIDFLLRSVVPSYNVRTEPISDAATITRPANLRGLASDHTMVLINGKRRHRGSIITWLGAGLSDGSQGVDIGSIPGIALRQVEVLRDGASAQYGSDAIAGVMNFILKDDRTGGAIQMKRGSYYEGDGDMLTVAGNVGVPLGSTGFANFSVEYGNQDPTDRAIQRADALALLGAGNSAVRQPSAQIWGSPEVNNDLKMWLNTGYTFNDDEQFYAFGNLSTKEVDGGFFFRNPNTRGAVFSPSGDENGQRLLIGDVLDARDGVVDGSANCPVVRITNHVPDPAALAQVFADPNCFSFQEMFPGGFTPQFGGNVTDWSFVSGVKGGNDSGFTWDASASFGSHTTDFFIYNTVNAALGPETPTDFDPGLYQQQEFNLNFDVAYEASDQVHIAGGLERRDERFTIGQGQDESWKIGPYAQQGFSSSSNGFPGFSPIAAGDWDRQNVAIYGDVHFGGGDSPWTIGTALRWEDFSDFGSQLTGKVSGRLEVSDKLALRAGGSTGFRAPTPGQQNAFNVSTVFDATIGDLVNRGTIPSTSGVADLRGGQQLQPEKAFSLTAGAVLDADAFKLTMDYYRISISDRFAQTKTFKLSDDEVIRLLSEGITSAANLAEFRFFTNDFSTRTQGIDLVANYSPPSRAGATSFSLLFNYTGTTVTDFNPEVVDEDRLDQLEHSIPSWRGSLNVVHTLGKVRGLLRGTWYDSWVDVGGVVIGGVEDTPFPGRFLVDLELSTNLTEDTEIAIGATNLFDTYPATNDPDTAGSVGLLYPESSPFGFNGGYYYVRVNYRWSWLTG
ncbi:TonB-dependent receptor [Candidatus Palauibacter sp.]|uniref:TonB-dependent receptor n=1 Tax=Candidatus Palauibacter sp. TaxID=3101350 RepID=UPI003AF297D2